MTKDLIERLIAAGLTKQQASSVTAETLVNLFMNDDGKTLIREAQQQVSEMHALIKKLRVEYDDLVKKINTVSAVILSVSEAQSEYGLVTDEKAKNIVALYAALLSMNAKAGADGADSVKNAGYILYAYLGGQAKREVSYISEE